MRNGQIKCQSQTHYTRRSELPARSDWTGDKSTTLDANSQTKSLHDCQVASLVQYEPGWIKSTWLIYCYFDWFIIDTFVELSPATKYLCFAKHVEIPRKGSSSYHSSSTSDRLPYSTAFDGSKEGTLLNGAWGISGDITHQLCQCSIAKPDKTEEI